MEKDAEPQKRQHCRTAVLTLVSSFCSVASVAVCILLSVNAADMRNRVVDLESATGEHAVIRASGYSADDLNSLIAQRVDELLSQVNTSSRAVFTRSFTEITPCLSSHISALLREFREDSDCKTNVT